MLSNRMQMAASSSGFTLSYIGTDSRGGSTPTPFPAGTQEGDYLVLCRPNYLLTPQVGGTNMSLISIRNANTYGVSIWGAVLDAAAISAGETSVGGRVFVYRASSSATFTANDGGTARSSTASVTIDLTAYSYDHYVTVGAAVIDESAGSSPEFYSITQSPSFDFSADMSTTKGDAGMAKYSSDTAPSSVQIDANVSGSAFGILVTGLIGVTQN